MNDTKELYERTAPVWREKVWAKSEPLGAQFTALYPPKNYSRLLDVGVGSGELETLLGITAFTGVDFATSMALECKKAHPNAAIAVADASELPFKPASFDTIISRNLLQHVDIPEYLQEVRKTLRPGGKYLLWESAVWSGEEAFITSVARVVEPAHPYFPTHESLRLALTNAGFTVERQEIGRLHATWVGKWCKAKNATPEQRRTIVDLCEQMPSWYKKDYCMTIHRETEEVESDLTFAMILATN